MSTTPAFNLFSGDLDFDGSTTYNFRCGEHGERVAHLGYGGGSILNFNSGTTFSVTSGTAQIVVNNYTANFNGVVSLPAGLTLVGNGGTINVNAPLTARRSTSPQAP